jgi:hypothetical protein
VSLKEVVRTIPKTITIASPRPREHALLTSKKDQDYRGRRPREQALLEGM